MRLSDIENSNLNGGSAVAGSSSAAQSRLDVNIFTMTKNAAWEWGETKVYWPFFRFSNARLLNITPLYTGIRYCYFDQNGMICPL